MGAAPTPGNRRILVAAVLGAFAFAALAGSAEAASSLYVSTGGSDRNRCTRLKPCRTFDRAYRLARAGQAVLVRSGVYRSQVIRLDRRKTSWRDVVFRPAVGARVVLAGRLDVRARHLEIRGLRVSGWRALSTASDLTFRSVTTGYFRIHGANGVKVLGGSVGPSMDVPSLVTESGTRAARNVIVDGTTIHGYHASAPGSSLSCLTVTGVSGLTIRKSHLYDCEFAGLLFEKGGAASPTNVTVENSEIECCRSGSHAIFLDDQGGASWSSFLVRNNSTNAAIGIDPASTTLADLRFYSNIASSFTGCGRTGVAVDYNVWETGTGCGTADVVAPSGFVDQEERNFELLPGAAAIDLGAPPGYPASDIVGETRPLGDAPDAGARESRATGLVAAYGFNEPLGPSARDASGLGNDGLVAGASPTAGGRFGGALSFDGVDDSVSVADAASLDLSSAMTLEAWVRPTALGSWRTVVLKEAQGLFAYGLYADTSSDLPSGHVVIDGADLEARGTSQLPLNAWTHLTTTFDGSHLRLYVNGAQVSSRGVSGSMADSAEPLRVGGNAIWGEWFRGQIDEVRVYRRALSSREVEKDMGSPVREASDTNAPTAPPALLKGGETPTSISVYWDASTDDVGVAGYGLYRNGTNVASSSTTSYAYSGLACETTYTLAVDAYDSAGNRSAQATLTATTATCPAADTQAPTAPTGLTKTGSTQTSVSVSWNASSDDVGVSGYDVYRDGSNVGSTAGTNYVVSGLACGTTYLLAVEARDAAGNRSPRATLAASTSACPAGSADLYLAPTGSDTNPCSQAAPCRSLERAYRVAQPGDVVEVAGGTYATQRVTFDASKRSSADVVFRAAAGQTPSFAFSEFESGHITIEGLTFRDEWRTWDGISDFTFKDTNGTDFIIFGTRDVTILGGEYGPSPDAYSFVTAPAPGATVPTNILIDGVRFHDYTRSSASEHTECLHVVSVQNLTIRNSRFERCAVMGLFLTSNPNSSQPFRNVVIENNFFGETISGGYYTVFFDRRVRFEGVQFRNNSLAQTPIFESGTSNYSNFVVSGNLGEQFDFMCNPQVSYSFNVWYSSGTNAARCGATDLALNGTSDPGWVDSVVVDLHLRPGSPGIDRGGSICPATDIDGNARPQGVACDAGADE